MPSSKPTVVILGQGWSTPQTYAKLTAALRSQDYEVHIPLYSSMNQSRPPNGNLVTDTIQIRGLVEALADDGHEIIILSHSYGGPIAANALCGLGRDARVKENKKGGVLHLLFVCAHPLLASQSTMQICEKNGDAHLIPLVFDFDHDNTCISRYPELMIAGGEPATEEESKAYLSSLKRWNGTCMYEPIQRTAWKEIPLTYVYTDEDQTLPMKYQEGMVKDVQEALKAEGKEMRTIHLKAGHGAPLTATQSLVDVVEEIAQVSA